MSNDDFYEKAMKRAGFDREQWETMESARRERLSRLKLQKEQLENEHSKAKVDEASIKHFTTVDPFDKDFDL